MPGSLLGRSQLSALTRLSAWAVLRCCGVAGQCGSDACGLQAEMRPLSPLPALPPSQCPLKASVPPPSWFSFVSEFLSALRYGRCAALVQCLVSIHLLCSFLARGLFMSLNSVRREPCTGGLNGVSRFTRSTDQVEPQGRLALYPCTWYGWLQCVNRHWEIPMPPYSIAPSQGT